MRAAIDWASWYKTMTMQAFALKTEHSEDEKRRNHSALFRYFSISHRRAYQSTQAASYDSHLRWSLWITNATFVFVIGRLSLNKLECRNGSISKSLIYEIVLTELQRRDGMFTFSGMDSATNIFKMWFIYCLLFINYYLLFFPRFPYHNGSLVDHFTMVLHPAT